MLASMFNIGCHTQASVICLLDIRKKIENQRLRTCSHVTILDKIDKNVSAPKWVNISVNTLGFGYFTKIILSRLDKLTVLLTKLIK